MLEIPERIWKRIKGYTKPQKVYRTNHEKVLCWQTVRRAGRKKVVIKLFEWEIVEETNAELRTAKVLMNIDHPHLVKVLDVKEDEELGVYYVMEYWGEDLREAIRTFPPRQDSVIDVIKQLLEGVAELHKHNLVHRDIKPENIFLKGNQVKLGDYGLVKSKRWITQLSTAGTPGYMPPEPRDARDSRWDIYSIGIVLLELLTSQRNIDSSRWLSGFLPDKDGRTAFRPELREVILKATAKEPDKRFGSAEAFIRALNTLTLPSPIEGEGIPSLSSPLAGEEKPARHLVRPHMAGGGEGDRLAEPISQAINLKRQVSDREKSPGLLIKNLQAQFDQLQKKRDITEAGKVGEELVRAIRDQLGPSEPYLSSAKVQLAHLYVALNDYSKAEPLYQEALEIDSRKYGRNSREALMDTFHLAELHLKTKEYAQARTLYQDAREMTDEVWKRDYTSIEAIKRERLLQKQKFPDKKFMQYDIKYTMAIILNQTGIANYYLTEYDKALRCYENALDINEKNYGEKHESVAINLYNLALTYEVQGNKSAAEPLYQRARAIGEPR